MSESAVLNENTVQEFSRWPVANEAGKFPDESFENVYAPANLGGICLLALATGWLAGFEALLPEATESRIPDSSWSVYESRDAAIINALEMLIAWCGEQKDRGGKKHHQKAEQLQDWALQMQTKVSAPSPAPESPVPQTHGATVEQNAGDGLSIQPSDAPQIVPIEFLKESPLNPRTYYPEAKMQELEASMRESGFRPWQPIVARLVEGLSGEVGAGHRRLRAAKRAGLTHVPCVLRVMTDEEFEKLLNFDNSGREDVHPLDESAGWLGLMERRGLKVADIAREVGQSESYVYQRLQYRHLIEDVRRAFLDGKITAGHASLFVPIAPEKQKLALKEGCFNSWSNELSSVRRFAGWIQQNLRGADLSEAPFDRRDAELVRPAGSCEECSKRQGDLCFDGKCFDGKVEAHVRRQTKAGLVAVSTDYNDKAPGGVLVKREYRELKEAVAPEPSDDEFEDEPAVDPEPSCEFAESAVIAHGSRRGETIRICRNPKCPEHGNFIGDRSHAGGASSSGKDFWAERAKNLPRLSEIAGRRAVLAAVLRAQDHSDLTREQLRLIAEALLPYSVPPDVMDALDLPGPRYTGNGSAIAAELKKSIHAADGSPMSDYLTRIVLGLALYETAKEYCGKGSIERLYRAAGLRGIDHKQIAADVSTRMKEDFQRRRDAAKAKKPAKPAPAAPAAKVAEQQPTRKGVIGKLPTLGAPAPAKKAAAKPAAKKPTPPKKADPPKAKPAPAPKKKSAPPAKKAAPKKMAAKPAPKAKAKGGKK